VSTHDAIIRVVVTDDHPLMRDGLKAAIDREPDMAVVGEASDGAEAIDRYRALLPDVMLLDLQMPNVDGLQAIEAIRGEHPLAKIIVLTTYPGDARVLRAMTLGAKSYLLKSAPGDEILKAIRGVMRGTHSLAPEVALDLASHLGSETLTDRELAVLQLVAAGKSNRAIGEELHLAEDTIKSRMKNILMKLDASDRTHAVTIAVRRGFIQS
jgi:DNA-binding NarL/FixJ family response regulator